MKTTNGIKYAVIFGVGLLLGAVGMGALVWSQMPKKMLVVHQSKAGFDQTVEHVLKAAKDKGWSTPKVYDIQASLKKDGYEDIERIKIISLCQADHAYSILKSDANKKVTAIMPCRIGIYEDKQGRVFISGMNIGLMSKMFGGDIARVMGKVEEEEHEILAPIIADES